MKMVLSGKDKLIPYDPKVLENLKTLSSVLRPADIMIYKLRDKDWGTLHGFVKWMNEGSDYCHNMFYFGTTDTGLPLILEERKPRGAKITTLHRHIGRPAEAYRINHKYRKEFAQAIIRAGEIIADSENSFFDYPAIPRMILERFGVVIKYRPKYNQLYTCSELIRACLERAKEFLDKDLAEIYEKDILAEIKIVLPFYKVPRPGDYVRLKFCQKVWEGIIGY